MSISHVARLMHCAVAVGVCWLTLVSAGFSQTFFIQGRDALSLPARLAEAATSHAVTSPVKSPEANISNLPALLGPGSHRCFTSTAPPLSPFALESATAQEPPRLMRFSLSLFADDKTRQKSDDNPGNNLFQPLPDHTPDNDPQLQNTERRRPSGFDWNSALQQSTIFLGIQHAFRLATEKGSRADLKGPFFKDYFTTLTKLRGWDDGDPFLVNYIGHPMMGSVTGFIQIQNDPRGIKEEVSFKKPYWMSRLKATAFSFAYSTQFELGLVSEASLGNVGIRPYDGRKHPMAYVDIVVTPIVGTGWLVGEDLLDRYLIQALEKKISNRVTFVLFRSFLNPTRSFANILRGKTPWYRDNRK